MARILLAAEDNASALGRSCRARRFAILKPAEIISLEGSKLNAGRRGVSASAPPAAAAAPPPPVGMLERDWAAVGLHRDNDSMRLKRRYRSVATCRATVFASTAQSALSVSATVLVDGIGYWPRSGLALD